jgi:hypothetical protein
MHRFSANHLLWLLCRPSVSWNVDRILVYVNFAIARLVCQINLAKLALPN